MISYRQHPSSITASRSTGDPRRCSNPYHYTPLQVLPNHKHGTSQLPPLLHCFATHIVGPSVPNRGVSIPGASAVSYIPPQCRQPHSTASLAAPRGYPVVLPPRKSALATLGFPDGVASAHSSAHKSTPPTLPRHIARTPRPMDELHQNTNKFITFNP